MELYGWLLEVDAVKACFKIPGNETGTVLNLELKT